MDAPLDLMYLQGRRQQTAPQMGYDPANLDVAAMEAGRAANRPAGGDDIDRYLMPLLQLAMQDRQQNQQSEFERKKFAADQANQAAQLSIMQSQETRAAKEHADEMAVQREKFARNPDEDALNKLSLRSALLSEPNAGYVPRLQQSFAGIEKSTPATMMGGIDYGKRLQMIGAQLPQMVQEARAAGLDDAGVQILVDQIKPQVLEWAKLTPKPREMLGAAADMFLGPEQAVQEKPATASQANATPQPYEFPPATPGRNIPESRKVKKAVHLDWKDARG